MFTGSLALTSPTPFDHVPPLIPSCVNLGIFSGIAFYRFCSDTRRGIREMIRRKARGMTEHDEDDEYAGDADHIPFYNVRRMRRMVDHHPDDL